MLLVLMSNLKETSFNIHGISKEENILLKEDLNELFVALNNLSEKEEIKIPLLEKNKQNNACKHSRSHSCSSRVQVCCGARQSIA